MPNSGICYTWSGDKKKYEPDLFKAQLHVSTDEWCYKRNSNDYDDKTLVFGDNPDDIVLRPSLIAYLPYGGLSINHNIQANGEDHYSLLGGYTNPPFKWSPPPGVDGPFDDPYELKYPYYVHTVAFSYYTFIYYGTKTHGLTTFLNIGDTHFYGNKK